MSASFVLTVVSDDHPGIVGILSQVIADHEGNWTESSMMSLGGKFAGILLVHVPEQRATAFVSSLEALETEGLQIVAQRSHETSIVDTAREYSFDLVGQDRPGIIREITEILAKHSVNVQELETTVQSASMSGESLFMAHARIFVPPETDLDVLQEKLEELANELMVDIELEA
jgi:glycine cleavage system regulatory protein